jgi:hypothetical protein
MGLQQITGNEIAAGSIAATDLASASITGDKLGATSINANNIVGGTITTTQIASNTISNTNIQTGAIENYSRATGLLSGMRNRIINGAMRIDQRNAGANTLPSNGQYQLDRWQTNMSVSSKFSVQQDSSANTVSGFVSSLKVTSTSAYSSGTGDYFTVTQPIEGFNTADLAFGTASAKNVTLSFWVRSSLTGTFGGALMNNDFNRSYPFTYTIVAADTWEYKTITIPGDTTGTWVTGNTTGIQVHFGLGSGSTYSGTAGAWVGSMKFTATGATSVVGTLGATWYVTGVQLEEGSTATSFDYRPYTTELQLCQRYFETTYNPGTAVGTSGLNSSTNTLRQYSSGDSGSVSQQINFWFRVTKRSAPTVVQYNPVTGATGSFYNFDASSSIACQTTFQLLNGIGWATAAAGAAANARLLSHYTADSEL